MVHAEKSHPSFLGGIYLYFRLAGLFCSSCFCPSDRGGRLRPCIAHWRAPRRRYEKCGQGGGHHSEHARQDQGGADPGHEEASACCSSRREQLNSLNTHQFRQNKRGIPAGFRPLPGNLAEETCMQTATPAWESAGESLRPSLPIHIVLPDFFNCRMKCALFPGRTAGAVLRHSLTEVDGAAGGIDHPLP